jgi:hypothetical protein
MLGRPLSVEHTVNRLFDAGVPFEWYEIDYFDRHQSEIFIENYLGQSKYKPHERHPENFQRARKTVLDWLETSVPEGVNVRSLIGYAPVLAFIAKLLDVGNPFQKVNELERAADQRRPGALLRLIAEGILHRETGKVEDTPDPALRREFLSARAWAPDEQCRRFLAKKARYELQTRPPAGLPLRLRPEYEESVADWLGDHPFNNQPVFEDYIYARLFSKGDVEQALVDAVRQFLRSEQAAYRPTPLLLWFISEAGDNGADGEEVSVEATDFGFVYESAVGDAASDVRTSGRPGRALLPKLTLTSAENGSALIGELRFPERGKSSDKTGGRKVRVHLRQPEEGLWFWRQLALSDIAIGSKVRVGVPAADFLLGPDIDLECEDFECDASIVQVTARSDAEAVVLSARQYIGDGTPEIFGLGGEKFYLRVTWEPRNYPWNQYPRAEPPDPRLKPGVKAAFLKLRRLLLLFRARGYEDVARSADLIDNPELAGAGQTLELLAYCLKNKLILQQGGFYVLNLRELSNRGIHWEDLRGRRISARIAEFLERFVSN